MKRSTRARRPRKPSDAGSTREPSTARPGSTAPTPAAEPRLDRTDPRAVASWLADLRVQVDDIVAAALDATAPPARRMLGRGEARRQIEAAARKCRALFALAGGGAP